MFIKEFIKEDYDLQIIDENYEGVPELNYKQLSRAIVNSVRQDIPLFIWGPPGVGKTQIVAATAKNNSWGFKDMRLGNMEVTDVRGLPFRTKNEHGQDVVRYIKPEDLPTEKETEGYPYFILFLDEVNNAPFDVQSTIFQLTDQENRGIDQYKLPANVRIIAAGNNKEYGGGPLRDPLKQRFQHVFLDANVEGWLEYAQKANYHPVIIKFLQDHPEYFYQKKGDESKTSLFAYPRAWKEVDKSFKYMDQDDDFDPDTDLIMQGGTVGKEVFDLIAPYYVNYRKRYRKTKEPTELAQKFYSGEIGSLDDHKEELKQGTIIKIAQRLGNDLDRINKTPDQITLADAMATANALNRSFLLINNMAEEDPRAREFFYNALIKDPDVNLSEIFNALSFINQAGNKLQISDATGDEWNNLVDYFNNQK